MYNWEEFHVHWYIINSLYLYYRTGTESVGRICMLDSPLVGICFLGDFLLLATFSLGLFFKMTLLIGSVLTTVAERLWLRHGTFKGISSIFTVISMSSTFWFVMTESWSFPFLEPDWRSVSTTVLDVVTTSGGEGVGTGITFWWWSSVDRGGYNKSLEKGVLVNQWWILANYIVSMLKKIRKFFN